MTLKVLVTCPPMLGMIEEFRPLFERRGVEVTPAKVVQTLSQDELCGLLPQYDGWIIGDDPATRRVFEAGKAGRLKAAVKWGIGVDNVDFAACKDLGIPITNCPNMFGGEVADVGMSYLAALARETFTIDRGVRDGKWPKPRGLSLSGRTLGLIGLGDIGRNLAGRALAAGMKVVAYDPFYQGELPAEVQRATWPARVEEADFLAFTCALTAANTHMLNADVLARCKRGVRITNVARGPLIDEQALIAALQSGQVHSVALDVFEVEPLPMDSPLRGMPNTIFGSHNGSNTVDGVVRCSHFAIATLLGYLGVPETA
ncbi:D-3-phosphoglycerate dehydrogenase [Pelomonas aquatica]|uniref:D-3-phosphoglycerate dehydrogenase n=1 Tax=Pelomonas aquatica TaxID=431058 RepID=A0ABU1Z539_9BURK|nr:phosphoglycerate dehydrogenase [Pelomonas aquatica]MDR7295734.1 D-3-phosphoglycerate dehydrogenase [Pelomonas aquatica]